MVEGIVPLQRDCYLWADDTLGYTFVQQATVLVTDKLTSLDKARECQITVLYMQVFYHLVVEGADVPLRHPLIIANLESNPPFAWLLRGFEPRHPPGSPQRQERFLARFDVSLVPGTHISQAALRVHIMDFPHVPIEQVYR